jgi:hypothetical protein
MPNGWDPAAGFPAVPGELRLQMKDIFLLSNLSAQARRR